MPTIDIMTRSDTGALIPEPIVSEIIDAAARQSAVLATFRRVTVPVGVTRMPVLAGLPFAFWQNPSETGLREATRVNWTNRQIVCEDVSVIVPVPRTVLNDSQFDIGASFQKLAADAIAYELDRAAFVGGGQTPASFPAGIAAAALAAGNNILLGTTTAAAGGVSGDMSAVLGFVEADGYVPTHIATHRGFRARVRNARDSTGQQILAWATTGDHIYGLPVSYDQSGVFGPGTGFEAIAYDASQYVVGIAADVTIRLDESGVISSRADGRVLTNLMQSNMIALILNMRVGWQYGGSSEFAHRGVGVDEVQTVAITGSPTGGTFTLTYGAHAVTFPFNATAADVQAGYQALPSVGQGNAVVARTGSAPNFVYTFTYRDELGRRDVPQVVTTSALTGGTTPITMAATVTPGTTGSPYAAAVLTL